LSSDSYVQGPFGISVNRMSKRAHRERFSPRSRFGNWKSYLPGCACGENSNGVASLLNGPVATVPLSRSRVGQKGNAAEVLGIPAFPRRRRNQSPPKSPLSRPFAGRLKNSGYLAHRLSPGDLTGEVCFLNSCRAIDKFSSLPSIVNCTVDVPTSGPGGKTVSKRAPWSENSPPDQAGIAAGASA